MKQNPLTEYFGLTKKQLWMLLGAASALVCIIVGYPVYRFYPLARILFPGPTPTATIPALSISTPVAYIPAPSLTGWPSGTPATMLPSITPSRTPSKTPSLTPTRTPSLTPTKTPTRTPSRTPTNTTTPTSTPTATLPPLGTYLNPVPIGSSAAFPGLGSLTVLQSSWTPGKAGLVIVELSFTCDPSAAQACDLGDFIIHAEGSSGHSYVRDFDPAIPEPAFGLDQPARLNAGATATGYFGFVVTEDENSLRMRVQVFLQEGEIFFWLQPAPPAG